MDMPEAKENNNMEKNTVARTVLAFLFKVPPTTSKQNEALTLLKEHLVPQKEHHINNPNNRCLRKMQSACKVLIVNLLEF